MALELTAVFRKVPEGYIAFVEELPGAVPQGATLEEARANPREAAELTLEANRALAEANRVKRADVIRHLAQHGCELFREGGNHSIYVDRPARKSSSGPRSATVSVPGSRASRSGRSGRDVAAVEAAMVV
jgi:predicted RNase H-like HicB family nuclease